jgi:glycosyltransferase involved in cell wall biosynthesis
LNKIRVLHIITRLDPGGSATNTLETVRRLDPARFEVDLVSGKTDDPSGNVQRFVERHGIRCIFINDLVRNVDCIRDIKAFIALVRAIRRGQYAIVHTHSSKAGIMGRWAARFAGVKAVVHTPHGHVFYGYFSRLTTGIFIMAERVTALITDVLIELTPQGVEDHLALGIGRARQWAVVPSGIDLNQFTPDPRARACVRRDFGIRDDELLLLCVGRLEAVKGQSALIDAMPQVVAAHSGVRLIFVGDGRDRPALEARARRLGLERQVFFAGFRDDPAACHNAADIFILSSLNEGMGRAAVEAMACGKPVVLSRTGGMAGLIDDGVEGFLCPPGDPSALAKAVIRLANDPALRADMAVKARSRAGDYFSLDAMIAGIQGLYERILQ